MKLPGTRDALLNGLARAALASTLLASAPLIAPAAMAKAPPVPAQNGPQADFPMTVGAPYQVGGVSFIPSDSMNFDSVGYASVGTEGGNAISAAHHTLPVPSYAEVTDIETGRTILVRIDRRGPMDGSHAIELSPGAAAQLGIASDGKAAVRVRRVNPPENERALLRSGQPAPERMATPKPLLDVLQRKLNPALAQRTLDSADEDAGPAKPPMVVLTPKPAIAATKPAGPMAKPAITPKPVIAPPKPAPAPKPAMAESVDKKMAASNLPPKGYVPSVPAPTTKLPAEKAKSPGTKAVSQPAQMPDAKPPVKTASAATAGTSTAVKPGETNASSQIAKPATKPAAAAEKASGSFTVQAGAFSDKARAQAVADKIGGTLSNAGKVWRVRVGPYAGHGSAEAALAKVKSAGYSDARIQRAE